jgi:uncharacterized protein YdaU (DUF1376 family)
MSEQPYMQLWIADYLGDTQHLTAEQSGCYLHLLFSMWRAGGYLPNHAGKLAQIARVPLERWREIGPDVMALMTQANGSLTQKRLLRELEKARAKADKRSAAGRAGVAAKALKNNGKAQANGSANGQAKHTQRSSIYQSQLDTTVSNKKRTALDELKTVLDDEHAKAVIEHRQKLRKPLTAHAAKLLASKLAKCPDANAAADAMVMAGWQGFEPSWLENRAHGPPKQNTGSFRKELPPEIPPPKRTPEEQISIDAQVKRAIRRP